MNRLRVVRVLVYEGHGEWLYPELEHCAVGKGQTLEVDSGCTITEIVRTAPVSIPEPLEEGTTRNGG